MRRFARADEIGRSETGGPRHSPRVLLRSRVAAEQRVAEPQGPLKLGRRIVGGEPAGGRCGPAPVAGSARDRSRFGRRGQAWVRNDGRDDPPVARRRRGTPDATTTVNVAPTAGSASQRTTLRRPGRGTRARNGNWAPALANPGTRSARRKGSPPRTSTRGAERSAPVRPRCTRRNQQHVERPMEEVEPVRESTDPHQWTSCQDRAQRRVATPAMTTQATTL